MDVPPIWPPQRKTKEDGEAVKAVYERFASRHDVQKKKFDEMVAQWSADEKAQLDKALRELGLTIDYSDHHVKYLKNFEPIALDYDVCYVRHGKTEGNTEPRIYQGYCNYWENQLNETGKKQAEEAAAKMEQTFQSGWKPDLIVLSPLGRAIDTGRPFFEKHSEIPTITEYEAREQQFGVWDNQQLRFMDQDDICHLFYLEQNSLVKAPKPHIGPGGKEYPGENFVELILRQAKMLRKINERPEVQKAKSEGRRAKVLFYGHSMAGAAVSALLGHGKQFDCAGSIGFDGKYIMPNATPTMLPAMKPEGACKE